MWSELLLLFVLPPSFFSLLKAKRKEIRKLKSFPFSVKKTNLSPATGNEFVEDLGYVTRAHSPGHKVASKISVLNSISFIPMYNSAEKHGYVLHLEKEDWTQRLNQRRMEKLIQNGG